MKLTKGKSVLILAPSLISEALSLKLTSIDNNLDIILEPNSQGLNPDLVIWNILNYQSEELLRLELIKLKERFLESKVLVIFSIEQESNLFSIPMLNTEGLLLNPSAEKVLESLEIIMNGGRVFDLEKFPVIQKKEKTLISFNQKILSSGLKQIDHEINNLQSYLNNDSLGPIYKLIIKGRLRELITAKSLLIFLWGNSLDIYNDNIFSNKSESINEIEEDTVFVKDKNSLEIWNLISKRILKKFTNKNIEVEITNPTFILAGLKKDYITKLMCNIINELDSLIINIKENYKDDSYKDNINSLIFELNKNTIVNIADSYLLVKKNEISVSLNEYIFNAFNNFENDFESHDLMYFLEPIIKNEPLIYNGKLLPLYENESFKILESIITNWAIRNCNLLASEIFNYCSKWPELRNILICPKIQSTRDFERFRNNINNYNRWFNNISMPIYLYESKREYLDIIDNKFVKYYKNENREKELEKLEWFQKQVTFLIEIRDAVAPQLEIAFKYFGDFIVTLLTKVIGKSIGLIGKGIMQGLGRSNSK